jgi:hypothetical protein
LDFGIAALGERSIGYRVAPITFQPGLAASSPIFPSSRRFPVRARTGATPFSGPVTNTASVTTNTIDQDGTDNNGSVAFTIAPADVAPIPALDPSMLFLLAASLAVAATLTVRCR